MTTPMIPALSLWQPWATLIALGCKRIETRGWRTEYRGDVLIHAAKRWTRDEREYANDLMLVFPDELKPHAKTITSPPLGAALCVARLVDCQPSERLRNDISKLERYVGNYQDGRYGLLLEDIRPLPSPVAMGGQQSNGSMAWRVPHPLYVPSSTPQQSQTASPPPINPLPCLNWRALHERNPYLALLGADCPTPNTYDPAWCRLVDRVYAWTNAMLEIESARQSYIDARYEWQQDGEEIAHHLKMYQSRLTAHGFEACYPTFRAQIAHYREEQKKHDNRAWGAAVSRRFHAARQRLAEIEDGLNAFAELCGIEQESL